MIRAMQKNLSYINELCMVTELNSARPLGNVNATDTPVSGV